MEAGMDSYSNDHFAAAMGSEQNDFTFTDNYIEYPDPDDFQRSYTPGYQAGFLFGQQIQDLFADKFGQTQDLPRSSHEDLNQFFTDAAFANMISSPDQSSTPRKTDFKSLPPTSFGQDYAVSNEQWTLHDTPSLALVTTGLKKEKIGNTTVQHGQITPGDSPASPAKSARDLGERKSEKQSSRRKASSVQVADESAPVKRTRKPRKSSKKVPSPEQEMEKRETFLKRNREAAHKCRIKKKNQNEIIVDKLKALTEENALKGFQVVSLKQEVENLRALLLPHYQSCVDQKLTQYIDESSKRLPDWSKMGVSTHGRRDSTISALDEMSPRRASVATSKMDETEDLIAMSRDASSQNSPSSNH